MRIYNLIGYYDLHFKAFYILIPKIWKGCWKIQIKQRKWVQ